MKQHQLLLLAAFSGILLSLPWLNLMPGWILLVAFFPLFIIEDHFYKTEPKKNIAFFGYSYLVFGIWNLITTWWILYVSITSMILLVLLNAAFMAIVWWLFHRIKQKYNSKMAIISLLAFWITFEFIHYNWQIEWPWLTLGNGFSNQVKLIQWYEYTGVLGGSFWILVANIVLFQLYQATITKETAKTLKYTALLLFVILFPIFCSLYLYSHFVEKGEAHEIILLQPNIDPYSEKFETIQPETQLQFLLSLADSLITDSTEYILGPETALHPMWENQRMINHPYISPFHNRALANKNLKFILGATTRKLYGNNEDIPETARKFEDQEQYYDVFNSAIQIDKSGILQTYHKSVLVSGVEKMPFSKYLSFMETFFIDLGGTTGSLGTQKEPSIFTSKDNPSIAPIICYESIFGEYITKFVRKGASLIFVLTNDGWWKYSSGSKQHLSYSRIRAIETRRSIARSSNTGISAFINQHGEIVQQTEWWTRTAIKGSLMANTEITFYTIYGNFIGRISAFISVLVLLFYLASEMSGGRGYKTLK